MVWVALPPVAVPPVADPPVAPPEDADPPAPPAPPTDTAVATLVVVTVLVLVFEPEDWWANAETANSETMDAAIICFFISVSPWSGDIIHKIVLPMRPWASTSVTTNKNHLVSVPCIRNVPDESDILMLQQALRRPRRTKRKCLFSTGQSVIEVLLWFGRDQRRARRASALTLI
jgi:hypothetical protein